MPRKPDEVKEKVLELYKRGTEIKTIAETCGVSKSTVSKWARAAGITRKNVVDPDTEEKTNIESYEENSTIFFEVVAPQATSTELIPRITNAPQAAAIELIPRNIIFEQAACANEGLGAEDFKEVEERLENLSIKNSPPIFFLEKFGDSHLMVPVESTKIEHKIEQNNADLDPKLPIIEAAEINVGFVAVGADHSTELKIQNPFANSLNAKLCLKTVTIDNLENLFAVSVFHESEEEEIVIEPKKVNTLKVKLSPLIKGQITIFLEIVSKNVKFIQNIIMTAVDPELEILTRLPNMSFELSSQKKLKLQNNCAANLPVKFTTVENNKVAFQAVTLIKIGEKCAFILKFGGMEPAEGKLFIQIDGSNDNEPLYEISLTANFGIVPDMKIEANETSISFSDSELNEQVKKLLMLRNANNFREQIRLEIRSFGEGKFEISEKELKFEPRGEKSLFVCFTANVANTPIIGKLSMIRKNSAEKRVIPLFGSGGCVDITFNGISENEKKEKIIYVDKNLETSFEIQNSGESDVCITFIQDNYVDRISHEYIILKSQETAQVRFALIMSEKRASTLVNQSQKKLIVANKIQVIYCSEISRLRAKKIWQNNKGLVGIINEATKSLMAVDSDIHILEKFAESPTTFLEIQRNIKTENIIVMATEDVLESHSSDYSFKELLDRTLKF